MGRAYWLFLICVVGLFGWAGLTGSWNMFGNLPSLPFMRQAQPTSEMLNAPIIFPQMMGSTGITASQLRERFERAAGKVTWERSNDQQGWIMRYTIPVELTGKIAEGAIRFNFLADAQRAGVTGAGFHVVGWAEDGTTMTPDDITMTMSMIAAAVYQEGQP